MIELKLSNTSEKALVSAGDYDKVKVRRWSKCSQGYVVSYYKSPEGKETKIRLHHIILPPTDNKIIDHINRNKLDNRRENLRLATYSQNGMNRGVNVGSTTGFKGAIKESGKYVSKIKIDGRSVYIGTFNTPEDAAKAYNVMAEAHFGEFAHLNDIDHSDFSIEKNRVRSHGKYRGVCYHKRDKKWQASRSHKGRKYYIGQIDSEVEAARAYDDFLINVIGNYEDLNFKDGERETIN